MSSIQLKSFLNLSEEDAKIFYGIRYSDYVHSNFGGIKPLLNDHLEWMGRARDADNYEGYAITFDNSVIGGCSLKNISYINLNAEFDIFLSKESSGKGYAKMALKKLLAIGFKDVGLHRIYAFLIDSNRSALHLYTELGFKKEGVMRENVKKNSEYLSSIVIGLLSEEYEYHH